eukprot:TRINITY_DN23469_c0_g1_i1.p1 TRINITY_DN23469_c0_g1~~TRINITY_DN23469_c0_g1_i1.p1  ORF type:complete len:115 (+),score=5.09 TRINITY_DN23469_c0_g1_i1:112-456(+)
MCCPDLPCCCCCKCMKGTRLEIAAGYDCLKAVLLIIIWPITWLLSPIGILFSIFCCPCYCCGNCCCNPTCWAITLMEECICKKWICMPCKVCLYICEDVSKAGQHQIEAMETVL